jgi:F0F1-type ATP synthase membrane subunit a
MTFYKLKEMHDCFIMILDKVLNLLSYIYILTRTQIGEEEYRPWVPFIGTMFLFIFVSNRSGALLPWRVFELPHEDYNVKGYFVTYFCTFAHSENNRKIVLFLLWECLVNVIVDLTIQ